jgi:hypothetical protein
LTDPIYVYVVLFNDEDWVWNGEDEVLQIQIRIDRVCASKELANQIAKNMNGWVEEYEVIK